MNSLTRRKPNQAVQTAAQSMQSAGADRFRLARTDEQRRLGDGKAGRLGGAAGCLGTFDGTEHELEVGRVGEGPGSPRSIWRDRTAAR